MPRSKFPVKIGRQQDINPVNFALIQDHIDKELDLMQVNKQIIQITELDTGETDVPTIVGKINALLSAMNGSELTED